MDIPKFACFKRLVDGTGYPAPTSVAVIRLNESAARVADWVASVFLLSAPVAVTKADKLKAYFVSVCRGVGRGGILAAVGSVGVGSVGVGGMGVGKEVASSNYDHNDNNPNSPGSEASVTHPSSPNQPLQFIVSKEEGADGLGSRLKVKIRCNSMDLAADVIQDIAR